MLRPLAPSRTLLSVAASLVLACSAGFAVGCVGSDTPRRPDAPRTVYTEGTLGDPAPRTPVYRTAIDAETIVVPPPEEPVLSQELRRRNWELAQGRHAVQLVLDDTPRQPCTAREARVRIALGREEAAKHQKVYPWGETPVIVEHALDTRSRSANPLGVENRDPAADER